MATVCSARMSSNGPARFTRSSSFIAIKAMTRKSDSAVPPSRSTLASLSRSRRVSGRRFLISDAQQEAEEEVGEDQPRPLHQVSQHCPPARHRRMTKRALRNDVAVTESSGAPAAVDAASSGVASAGPERR